MPAHSLTTAQPMPRAQNEGPRQKDPLGLAPQHFEASVLCVDDEPDSLAVLEWFLTAEGLAVVTASSAMEALSRVEEQRPDVIITDYWMPGMTGLELCARLRRLEKTRGIPIIVYSALSLPAESWLYDRTLLKPTELEVFLSQIRSLLPRAC